MRKLEIKFELEELEQDSFHPLVRASFDGLENSWWVIDTGASKTVFDHELEAYYTLQHGEETSATGLGEELVTVRSAWLPDLWLGEQSFGECPVALVGFGHINAEYARFSEKRVVGLLGADFLKKHNAILDFRQQKLILDT